MFEQLFNNNTVENQKQCERFTLINFVQLVVVIGKVATQRIARTVEFKCKLNAYYRRLSHV